MAVGTPHARPAPAVWRERREPRIQTVRIVDYACFPRTAPDPGWRVGFTRDISPSGMCIGVDAGEPIGSLLRATLRNLDGSPARHATWRVVWCSAERDGRYWLGLELVAEAGAGRPGS